MGMDIKLNLSTPSIARPKLKTVPAKQKTNISTKKIKKNVDFKFNFDDGSKKVKAIVARPRPLVKKSLGTRKPTNFMFNLISKSPEKVHKNPFLSDKSKTQGKNNKIVKSKSTSCKEKDGINPFKTADTRFILKPSKDSNSNDNAQDEDENENDSNSHDNDIVLNICNSDVKQIIEERIQKLTKPRREKHNKANRGEVSGLIRGKVLSQQEIDEGIRRFSETNNRKTKPPPNCEDEKIKFDTQAASKVDGLRKKSAQDSSVKNVDLFTNNPEADVLGQRLVKPVTEKIFSGAAISSLDLHPHCIKNLADILSITELTTIQQKAIPHALQGKDILIRSQTGSGKTLAYALPVVELLQKIRPKTTRECGIMAVVIVPTRELAMQTYELFIKLLKPFTWIVPGLLIGGERRKAEKARLRKGINILVGTPGRLVDHLLHTSSFNLSKVKFLVLDEADRLLEMGYERDVKQIVEAIETQRNSEQHNESDMTPSSVQRLLLSATLTPAVQKLAGLALKQPLYIDNSDEDPSTALRTNGYDKMLIEDSFAEANGEDSTGVLAIPENLQITYVIVPPKLRLVTISGLLAKEFEGKKLKAIVFMSTMEMVNFHHDLFNEQLTQRILDDEDDEETVSRSGNSSNEPLLKGLRFFKLHGSMTQTERQGVFKSFNSCKSGVLLATDVAGRGIDVPEVDLVVQYSPPQKTSDFVHRVGRTARAGRSGRAVLFLTPNESQFVRYLEDKRIRISPTDSAVYLQALYDVDDKANTVQEAASNLQYKFQESIEEDREMHNKACKAFVSWMKFYSTFPKELKPIFNVRVAHMGHFAKSFGLKDEPKSFTKNFTEPKPLPPTNRLTYTERDPEKIKEQKRMKRREFPSSSAKPVNTLLKRLPNSRSLTTSEYDSGLPAFKKRKT